MKTLWFKNLISCVVALSTAGAFLFSAFVSVMDTAQAEDSIMLEDFDQPWGKNAFGGDTGTFDGGGGSCAISYVSAPSVILRGTGYSLKLGYYVPSGSWAGLWTNLMDADLQNYNAVSLWVKGISGGEKFRVGLRDSYTPVDSPSEVNITDYLSGGVTTAWQKVTIPFSKFFGVSWDKMASFSIAFNSSTAGTIYIDEIMFEYIPPIPITPNTDGTTLIIDDYNDGTPDSNSLGCWTGGDGPALRGLEEEYLHRYIGGSNKAKKIAYDVNLGNCVYFSNVWDDVTPLDASNFDYLSFRVKREETAEGYTGCHLKIRYGNPPGVETPLLYAPNYFLETDEWQLVNVPLSAFTGLDKTKLQSIIFFFDSTLPVKQGTLRLDNLQFSKGYGKPESTGRVRIDRRTRQLFVDSVPFKIKGVGYQPVPIGSGVPLYVTSAMCDRDFPYLVDMGCNTIRTWNGVSGELMTKAEEYGLKVIAGFWMDNTPWGTTDYSDPDDRAWLKQSFYDFVLSYKDSPAILMWALGNENNYKLTSANIKDFYSLCNELAQIAYEIEGESHHPVIIVNGDVFNTGVTLFGSDDLQLDYIDAWGANAYHRSYEAVDWTAKFYNWSEADADERDIDINWFELYKERSFKPIVITEYGCDAWNAIKGYEDEVMQADWVRQNTMDIINAYDVCLGGTLMAYSDEWWKAGDSWNQDLGPGYDWGENLPDRYVNEEWWGIMRIARDGTWSDPDGLDDVQERAVYYVLKALYDVADDNTGIVSVSDTASGYPGDVGVPVPVMIRETGLKEITSVKFTLKYYQSVLTATGVENGLLTDGWDTNVILSVPGEVTVSLSALPGSVLNPLGGELASVLFDVKSDALPAIVDLELTGVLLNEDPPMMTEDGSFQIMEEIPIYTLTVIDGTGSGVYSKDAVVNIEANAPATGQHFSHWSINSDTSNIANVNASSTTITMLSDTTITAEYVLNTYTLAITATNGSVSREPDQTEYTDGSIVKLTPVAEAGYQFTGWAGGDVPSGHEIDNPLWLTMDSSKSITANFEAEVIIYTLIISSTKGGHTIPEEGTYIYNAGDPVSIEAIADDNYTFTEWTGEGVPLGDENTNPLLLTMNSDKSITANFEEITYTLTISSTEDGSTEPAPGSYTYNEGTPVSVLAMVIATAQIGYGFQPGPIFTGWTGDVPAGHENDNPLELIMDSDKSITANFEEIDLTTYTLIVNNGTGSGVYIDGAVVNIEANAPPEGYGFSHWSGDTANIADVNSASTTITMLSDATITAEYEIKSYNLVITSSNGLVTKDPHSKTYNHGQGVKLTAVPIDGYQFKEWSGDITGNQNPIDITMDSDKSITANFELVIYNLTISSTIGGYTIPGAGTYAYNSGTTASVRAVAQTGYGQSGYGYQAGYVFKNWTGDVPSGHEKDNPVALIMDSNKSIRANFEIPVTYTLAITISGNGTVTKSPDQTDYASAAEVILDAAPSAGYIFVRWQGDLTGSANPAKIAMDKNKAVTAVFIKEGSEPFPHPWNFKPRTYPDYLPIYGTAAINGQRLYIGDWVGVFDGDGNCHGVGQYQFDPSRSKYYYALSAYPESSEDGLAGFSEGEPVFFKFYSPARGGVIDASPAPFAIYKYPDVENSGINPLEINLTNGHTLIVNNGSGSGVYEGGAIIDIRADTPAPGSRFDRWNIDSGTSTIADTSSSSTKITVLSHTVITAEFVQYGYILSITAENGSVTKSPDKDYYEAAEQVILTAVANSGYYFASWSGDITGTTNPITITMDSNKSITANFAALVTQTMSLAEGWNFVSFYVNPSDPSIEKVFNSILEKVEYVRNHMHWWSPATGGSLTEISAYHSYYIKTNGECVLTVTGIPVQLPYALELEKGWMSISYPYEGSASAIGRTQDPSVYNGFFKEIMSNIVWIKGADSWCTPEVGELELKRGKGIFIKLKNPCALNFPSN